MKSLPVLLGVVLLGALLPARAAGPDDEYVQIYSLIQEADSLQENGKGREALTRFNDVQAALKKFQADHPRWNADVLKFRLSYVAAKVASLEKQFPPATPARPEPAERKSTDLVVSFTTPAGMDQLKVLQDRIADLTAQRNLLEAKLKEALSVQPAPLDPAELAKVETKMRELQKENDLLKAVLAPSTKPDARAAANAELAAAHQKLTESQRNLDVQMAAATALKMENELLKKQFAELRLKAASAPAGDEATQELLHAKALVAGLEFTNQTLRAQQMLMDQRLLELAAQLNAGQANQPNVEKPREVPARTPDGDKQLINARATNRRLELENRDLQRKLENASKELKKRAVKLSKNTLQRQLTDLQARLAVYEAKPVPYSAEELALFSQPASTFSVVSKPPPVKRPATPPAGAGALSEEVRRAFAARRFDEAEQKLLQMLRQDEKNVFTLHHLAVTQFEMGKLDQVEKHVQTALAVDPDDAVSLYLLGVLRLRQNKHDEAFAALSRSAQLEPDNPDTQNSLGIALSQKGLRTPAENAFRRAIQADPGHAEAHYNLAVEYALQEPPATQLARWHYQKATANGHPHNADLEKRIDGVKASSAAK